MLRPVLLSLLDSNACNCICHLQLLRPVCSFASFLEMLPPKLWQMWVNGVNAETLGSAINWLASPEVAGSNLGYGGVSWCWFGTDMICIYGCQWPLGWAASPAALGSDSVVSSEVNPLPLHSYHGRQRWPRTDGHELGSVKRWENTFCEV